ncbi:MAG: DNA-directed RNA polymerase subunit K [Candidatus Methanomethylicia archaeon]
MLGYDFMGDVSSSNFSSKNVTHESYYSPSDRKILVGPPKLTGYEKARIIGARALQISLGAPILINVEGENLSPLEIAKRELERGILPLTVRRIKPDGSWQDIPISWLQT